MSKKFSEYKSLHLSQINKDILNLWKREDTFSESLRSRKGKKPFIFYEGPPSANGLPGIHHVISRTIKDIVCRYKTLQGYLVNRKAGWDTHGLPVELSVEKSLNITKEDIGKKISVTEYNNTCKKEVMKYTREWEDLTDKMGYWINMEDPYITFDNKYIETLWYLLKKIFDKNLLYKGYTVQPYSPAAGTGLSTHELNQPGCYRDVKDTTCVAQFKVIRNAASEFLYTNTDTDIYFLAWTTTPWTLPSNTALAVGEKIKYSKVLTYNQYSGKLITVILAKELMNTYFNPEVGDKDFDRYEAGKKHIPFKQLDEYPGSKLEKIDYEQLIDWVKPGKDAFKVLVGDFVTTEEGTGIVHIAPTFGADDFKIAQIYDFPAILINTKQGEISPLVDRKGRFIPLEDMDKSFVERYVNTNTYKDFAGRFVKNEYDENLPENAPTIDVEIVVDLKKNNKAFRIEKHIHNYPHCWRTDKPVLYYPLDSWFIKTTALKDRMIELNNTILWKPESTGTGRFGKWLENLVDWNLSRSRFWGTPLPIWSTEDGKERKCIGSVKELKAEINKAIEKGFIRINPLDNYIEGDLSDENYASFDLHRPVVDEIILVSSSGEKMFREPTLIDVWFDSGAMPYAQWHYPFSMKEEEFKKHFPADFIAEGVDQTRGWFFTLHAIACLLFDSVSFKSIISNGLVLDKLGNKMAKRLGNTVDPFETIENHGADSVRWYLMTNAQPWDNIKFDIDGVDEVKRKFFGTLYNTYSFFALYANVDGFTYAEKEIPVEQRPEIDQWIISVLNSLIAEVKEHFNNYELTRAGRAIQEFVTENLSNWYVRLNRKRFWGGIMDDNKIAAYQTLYVSLETVAILMSPIAPFFAERIYRDLNAVTQKQENSSVHLSSFPKENTRLIDKSLEEKMYLAQQITSMVLGLRRKVNIKVRQPLNKIIIPILDKRLKEKIDEVEHLILSEVNVKEIEFLRDTSGILVKKIKPDFKKLGPKYGKLMKQISDKMAQMDQEQIIAFENEGKYDLEINNEKITLNLDDIEIISEDIPGWLVANNDYLTIALDISITETLRQEGIARELVNRVQNLRKDSGFEVTDKIHIELQKNNHINAAVENFKTYISSQTLAKEIQLVERLSEEEARMVDFDETIKTYIRITKI